MKWMDNNEKQPFNFYVFFYWIFVPKQIKEVPIVFVGNKQDLDGEHKRSVQKEDVAEWIFCELPKLRAKV